MISEYIRLSLKGYQNVWVQNGMKLFLKCLKVILTLTKKSVCCFSTSINDFVIDDSEEGEEDDITAVPLESGIPMSVSFIFLIALLPKCVILTCLALPFFLNKKTISVIFNDFKNLPFNARTINELYIAIFQDILRSSVLFSDQPLLPVIFIVYFTHLLFFRRKWILPQF